MAVKVYFRSFLLVATLLYCVTADDQHHPTGFLPEELDVLAGEDSNLIAMEKRESYRKLRPHNPILIYHQSIRQPGGLFFPSSGRYASRTSVGEEPSGGVSHDIPRRLIRRNNHKGATGGRTDGRSNSAARATQLLVWNHQLLPNFYSKSQPLYLKNLRRDVNTSNNQKRSIRPQWMLPSAGGRSVSLDNTFESEQREADKDSNPDDQVSSPRGLDEVDYY